MAFVPKLIQDPDQPGRLILASVGDRVKDLPESSLAEAVRNKANEVPYVANVLKRYGAAPNDFTDSTPAVIDAIGDLSDPSGPSKGRGGLLYFPPGEYAANVDLPSLPSSLVQSVGVIGGGAGVTTIKAFDPALPVIRHEAHGYSRVVIRDLAARQDGDAEAILLTGADGEGLPNRTVGDVRRVHVQLPTGPGSGKGEGVGLSVRFALGLHVSDVTRSGGRLGMLLEYSSNCLVSNWQDFYNVTGGFHIRGGGAHVLNRVRIEDRFGTGTGISALLLEATRFNTILGFANEGKTEGGNQGMQYAVHLLGTGEGPASRPGQTGDCSFNRFIGGTIAPPRRTDLAGAASIYLQGECRGNTFAVGSGKASQSKAGYTDILLGEHQARFPHNNDIDVVLFDDVDFNEGAVVTVPRESLGNRIVTRDGKTQRRREVGSTRDLGVLSGGNFMTLDPRECYPLSSGPMLFRNRAASGTRIVTLPAAKAGMAVRFLADSDSTFIRVRPAAGDAILGLTAPNDALDIREGNSSILTLECFTDGFWSQTERAGVVNQTQA